MSRLSGSSVILQDAATKLVGNTAALATFSEAHAASAASMIDFADGLVADSTARAALSLGVTGNPISNGSGTNGADNYAGIYTPNLGTTLIETTIVIDIDGLVSAATDNDVIGDSAAANAHIGQVVAGMGTIFAGTMQCLELPTGGEVDIDLYGDADGTIAQSADGTTDTALVTSSGDWTLGLTQYFSAFPAVSDYLYLTVGTASSPTGATYTAGIFKITMFGK